MRIGSTGTRSDRPFESARFRFRNPLLPARPVSHTIERKGGSLEVVIHDEDTEYLTATLTLADE
jgi:hypothetical protein